MEPVILELDAPYEVARWRPLVQWFLAIPHWFVVSALGAVSQLLVFISFFTVLFTRRVPDGIYDFQAMYLRYQWRVTSYSGFLREPYPPFEFPLADADPGGDPAVLSLAPPSDLNRWLPLVKWLLAIPHFIVLFFVWIGAFFAWFAGFFAVLVTGRWPAGLREFIVGVERWTNRVTAYVYLLHDEYPPFSLE